MKTAIGTHIGRYQIDAEIGRGAMGLVYQAHDPKIDRLVAIKTISLFTQEIEEEKEFRERFFLEARAAGRLSHRGIVTIFDVGEEPETHEPYIVMEFVPGQSLNRILAGHNRKLPLGPALQIIQEIAEALHYAHSQGVIHRDIKPANILITLDGHPKIADFGIAKLNQGLMTMPGQVMGSPAYMAPEQLSGEGADARSDLFSLGVILYSMLTGFRPFQGNSAATVSFKVVNRDPLPVTSFDSEFPAELDRLVSRAIAKDPEQRYQTGMEMAQEIQRLRERHELMNQTAASLVNISSPEGTGVVKVPVTRPAGTTTRPSMKVQSPVEPSVEQEEAEFVDPRRATGRSAANIKAEKPALANPNASRAKAASSPFAGLPFGAIPKEFAIAGGCVLFLAIAFIGFEVFHKKPHAAREEQSVQLEPSVASNAKEKESASAAPQEGSADEVKATVSRAPRHPKVKSSKPTPKIVAKVTPTTQSQPQLAPAIAINSEVKPAAIQPVKSTIAPAPATANLNLKIEYQFAEAEASVWFDNQLIYSQKLYGESKKRAIVFKKVEGHEVSSVKVAAGEHRIHVRIQSTDEQYDQSKTVTGTFVAGSNSTLAITCDKRGHDHELQLALQ
jgi:serine/threonine protein kinase